MYDVCTMQPGMMCEGLECSVVCALPLSECESESQTRLILIGRVEGNGRALILRQ